MERLGAGGESTLAGPADFDAIDGGDIAEAKVWTGVFGGVEASADGDFAGLGDAAGGEANHGADCIGVDGGRSIEAREADFGPVEV